jgi:GGDEF domain-containing protein
MIDFFVPEDVRKKDDEALLMKCRVTISLSLLYLFSVLPMGVGFLVLALMDILVIWSAVIGDAIASVIYIFQLFYLKRTANLFVAANIVMAVLVVFTSIFCLITGGWTSSVLFILVCTPVCAFLMEGARSGTFWTLVTAIVYFLLLEMYLYNVQLPNVIPDNLEVVLEYFAWLYGWFMVFGAMTVYNLVSKKLSENMTQERKRLSIKATYDELTGCYSRTAFVGVLEERAGQLKGDDDFLFCSVDLQLKDIISRDEEMHLLQVIVKLLRESFPERCVIGRMGGMSFSIIIDEVKDESVAEEIASTCFSVLQIAFFDTSMDLKVGAVMVPSYSNQPDTIVASARKAIQEARHNDLDYVIYSDEALKTRKVSKGNRVFAESLIGKAYV